MMSLNGLHLRVFLYTLDVEMRKSLLALNQQLSEGLCQRLQSFVIRKR